MAEYDLTIPDGSITLAKLSAALQTEIGKIDGIEEAVDTLLKGIIERSIVDLVLPEGLGLTVIGSNCFNGCNQMKLAVIPEGVTKLNGASFNACSALKKIYLPSTLTQIGNTVFGGCSALTDVYFAGTQAQWSAVTIGATGNTYLTGATMHYESPYTPT